MDAENLEVLDLAQLIDNFFSLRRSNMRGSEKLAKKLKNQIDFNFDFELTPQSLDFSTLMIEISSILEECDLEEIVEEMNLDDYKFEYGESGKLLKRQIENYFLPKIRIYCKNS
jgi:hypothetical protein